MLSEPLCLCTGSILLTAGAGTSAYLVQLQLRKGISGFSLLSTSDTLAVTVTGILFILTTIDVQSAVHLRSEVQCDYRRVIMTAALFLAPFINAFISIFVHSWECYQNFQCSNEDYDCKDKNSKPVQNSIRIILALASQWLIPTITILSFLSSNFETSGLELRSTDESYCSSASLTIMPMEEHHKCTDQFYESSFLSQVIHNKDVTSNKDHSLIIQYIEKNKNSSDMKNVTHLILTKIYNIVKQSINVSEPFKQEYTIQPSQHKDSHCSRCERETLQPEYNGSKGYINDTDYIDQYELPVEERTHWNVNDLPHSDYENYEEFSTLSSIQGDEGFINVELHADNVTSTTTATSIEQSYQDLSTVTNVQYETSTDIITTLSEYNKPTDTESNITNSHKEEDIENKTSQSNNYNSQVVIIGGVPVTLPTRIPADTIVGPNITYHNANASNEDKDTENTNFHHVVDCLTQCFVAGNFLKTHLFIVLFICYFVPIAGAVTIHVVTTKALERLNRISETNEKPSTSQDSENNICQIKLSAINTMLKHFIILSVILWTPTFVETLLRVWFCIMTPQALSTGLFILAQFHGVVRNVLNVKLVRIHTKGQGGTNFCSSILRHGSIRPEVITSPVVEISEATDTSAKLFTKVKENTENNN